MALLYVAVVVAGVSGARVDQNADELVQVVVFFLGRLSSELGLLAEKIFEAAVLRSVLKQIFFKLIRDVCFTDSLILTEPADIIMANIGA